MNLSDKTRVIHRLPAIGQAIRMNTWSATALKRVKRRAKEWEKLFSVEEQDETRIAGWKLYWKKVLDPLNSR